MKKFTSIHDVKPEDILTVLDRWQKGELNRDDVFCYAEDLYYLDGVGWPQYSRSEPRAILMAVLQSLSMIYVQPTLVDDVPALKNLLILGQKDTISAWEFIDEYWKSVDWDERLSTR